MKLSALRLLAATTATLRHAAAFAPSPRAARPSPLRLSGDGVLASPKKVLTAADVEAKASTRAADPAAPNAEDAPQVFPPEIYDGFQAALLLLEQRARDGPGSLSGAEVGTLERETGRIVREMQAFNRDPKRVAGMIAQMYEKEGAEADEAVAATPADAAPRAPAAVAPAVARAAPPPPAAGVEAPPAAAAVALPRPPPPPAAVAAVALPPPPAAEAPTPFTAAEVAAVAAAAADGGARDVGEEEYHDDSVNHGLAKGTTNTYAIPGMHEMGAEEYRAKLQETISGRQRERRRLAHESGIIGNRSSNGYLDTLSAGGSGGMWKKTAASWKKKEEEEEETQG